MTTSVSNDSNLTRNEKLSAEVLVKMFGNNSCHYDLKEGTVVSSTDTRVIYLTEDIVHAIYDVLKFETADAWKLILKNCGYIWGKRVAASLEKEIPTMIHEEMDQISVAEYINLIESYFSLNGWGRVKIHLNDADTFGLLRVSMKNSLFSTALDTVDGPVDFMIAGILRGIFETISQHSLDCVQVCFESAEGVDSSEFLISDAKRIAAIENELSSETRVDDALEQLRAA